MFAALFAVLTLAAPDFEPCPVPVKLPSKDRLPLLQNGLPQSGDAPPMPRKQFFGIGVGFQTRGTVQGIALEQVIPGSPADRAGLTAGTVIAEINGVSTLGRSGEDCTRLVRDAGGSVVVKFYDPATFKLRTRTLEKDWFALP